MLAAAVALTCTAVSSAAVAAEPLQIDSVSPASGATVQPTSALTFDLSTGMLLEGPERFPKQLLVLVTKEDALDAEGRLVGPIVGHVELATEAYGGTGTAFDQSWSSTPGTYYWQARATLDEIKLSGEVFLEYLSPVFVLVIASPSSSSTGPSSGTAPSPSGEPAQGGSLALTVADARLSVKTIIRERIGHAAHRLTDKCHNATERAVICKSSWTTAAHLSSSTLLYAGSFLLENETDGFHYSFAGLRERYGCARRSGVKHCATKVYWHVVIPR